MTWRDVAPTGLVLLLLRGAALLLGPSRIGRLIVTVSLPRFHEHRLRATLTVLGITLGVGVLVAVTLLNELIVQSFRSTLDDIAGRADLQVSAGGAGFPESLFDTIRGVPGVYRATPVLQETTLVQTPAARGERVLIVGVDFLGDDDEYFRDYASAEMSGIKEDPIRFLNSRTNILISRKLAERYHYRLHDKIPLSTPSGVQEFEIWGLMGDEGVGRAFGGAVAVMYYQALQVTFERGDTVDRVDVAVPPAGDADAVAPALRRALGPGFDVERPQHKNQRVSAMLATLRSGLLMGGFLALLVATFLIHNTMATSVVQRRRELGILRALGAPRRQVLALLTLEGALLGAVGAALGIGLGVALAGIMLGGVVRTVSELYVEVAATELTVSWRLAVTGLGLGVAAAVLASLGPALQAMGLSPVEAASAGSTTIPRAARPRGRTGSGRALLLYAASLAALGVPPVGGFPLGGFAASLLILLGTVALMPGLVSLATRLAGPTMGRLLGAPGHMASGNVPRDLARVAVTASALMVGVAMATGSAVFISGFRASVEAWIEESVPADLFVTSAGSVAGSRTALADGLQEPLARLPGVTAVERQHIVDVDLRGAPVKALGTDFAVYARYARLRFLEGTEGEALVALQRGEVLVSDNLAHRFGVHAGDRLTLATAEGARDFRVAGVIVSYTSDLGTVFLDRPTFVRLWRDGRVGTYKLYLDKGADVEGVRRAINAGLGVRHGLFVLTNGELKAEIHRLLDLVFDVVRALELVTIVIAMLGVMSAVLASVVDRIRELGVLRAVGMLRRQVRLMVMTEAGLIGGVSAVTGIAAGLVLGYIVGAHVNVAQTGWFVPYRPAWVPIGGLGLLVVTAAILGGFYPAREAARLAVPRALEYE